MDIRQFFTRKQGIDNTNQEEGVQDVVDTLSLDIPDKDLVNTIDLRIKEASTKKNEIDKVNEVNEKFYLGQQIDSGSLYPHQAQIVDNRIFLAVDTIVPILATKKREPVVMPAQNTDESRESAILAQEYLSWKFNELKMHMKISDLVRFFNIYRYCVLKYRYVGEPYNDFVVEVKRPESIVIDNKANSDDIEFVGEYLEDTAENLLDKFAMKGDKIDKKKKDKILKELQLNDKQLGTKVKYLEFWTDDFVVWKVNNVILDKAKNPNYLWDTKGKKAFNHFSSPKKPYIILSWQNLLKGVYGDTTALEQAMTLQKNINKRKRQISDNADQANGTWVFNTKYFSAKEISKFTGAPNQHIKYEGDDPVSNAVTRLYAKDLGQQVFLDLQDDKNECDNIFGVHSTTRGERTDQKTATESNLLKQSDYGRLDLMSQYIDSKMEELYNAFIQMVLVYYDKMKMLKVLGPDKSKEFIEFSRDNIEEGIEIIVKTEPLLAKAEEIDKYMQLYKAGAVDPLTMYERLNIPNPKELTRRVIMFQQDPKMYLAEFAIDENTPGYENDPVVTAKKDIQAIENDEQINPQTEVYPEHIKEHTKYLKSERYKKLKVDKQQFMVDHVKAEMDTMKQVSQQVK
jgi:hypothetical protein